MASINDQINAVKTQLKQFRGLLKSDSHAHVNAGTSKIHSKYIHNDSEEHFEINHRMHHSHHKHAHGGPRSSHHKKSTNLFSDEDENESLTLYNYINSKSPLPNLHPHEFYSSSSSELDDEGPKYFSGRNHHGRGDAFDSESDSDSESEGFSHQKRQAIIESDSDYSETSDFENHKARQFNHNASSSDSSSDEEVEVITRRQQESSSSDSSSDVEVINRQKSRHVCANSESDSDSDSDDEVDRKNYQKRGNFNDDDYDSESDSDEFSQKKKYLANSDDSDESYEYNDVDDGNNEYQVISHYYHKRRA